MKNKNLIIALVLAAAVAVAILIARPIVSKKPARKAAPPAAKAAAKPLAKAPAKKAIAKGKGALNIKILDSKNKEMLLRARAFKVVDRRTSVYSATLSTNRTQELTPGAYDIEIDTIPQKICKDINVSEGRENIEDLGHITGSVNVRAVDSKGKEASYPVRIFYAQSNEVVTSTVTNRALEIVPGMYDVEVATYPRQLKKGVKIDPGKEGFWDLGKDMGALVIKTLDENKKEVRSSVRITKAENNELVATLPTNRPIEILKGAYNVEITSTPRQTRKDIKINAGEETAVEFTVEAPQPIAAPATGAKRK